MNKHYVDYNEFVQSCSLLCRLFADLLLRTRILEFIVTNAMLMTDKLTFYRVHVSTRKKH